MEVRDFEEWLRRGVENEQCLGFLNDKDILETIGSSRKPCGIPDGLKSSMSRDQGTKGLVAGCHTFCLFFIFYTYIHSFNHNSFIRLHSLKPLHFFIACMLSGEDLPVVPSRESNSGLPYSKPTRCQLSHAAPY